MIKTITNEEYINLSSSYGLEVEVIKAIEKVEVLIAKADAEA